jgi:hypothetical protein
MQQEQIIRFTHRRDLKTELGSERPSLERLRDAIEREEAEKHQGEDWSIAKDYVRSRLSWLA